MSTDCDIIINGGGMVGSAMACLLADSGLSVVILESNLSPGDKKASKDIRVSALTLATKNILDSIDAWQAVSNAKTRPAPIMEMHIWDAGSSGQIHFDSAEIGEPCLGYITSNQQVLDSLYTQLKRRNNLKIKFDCGLKDFEITRDQVAVLTEAGETMTASLLIGADGASSRVRTIAGLENHGWSYNQIAIVATVESEKQHNNTAWQRFLPTGPLAFLPLADLYQTSIVWSADTAYANELLQLNETDFKETLGQKFENHLGEIKNVGPRNGFPLTLAHAEVYTDERLALIGDAAHRMHPLAGQGVNMGLLDAAVLAEIILGHSEQGRDFGKAFRLKAYTRWRKHDNQLMLMATDGFKRVFGMDQSLLNNVRGMGMNFVSGLPPLRRSMMRMASGMASGTIMGMAGNLPRAALSSTSSRW
ncbi:MAG: UbiH/UbiF/VisC/COQ6 family ubiquinone biosynthesis hydroxylase [Acidiferrobacterales bacterium]